MKSETIDNNIVIFRWMPIEVDHPNDQTKELATTYALNGYNKFIIDLTDAKFIGSADVGLWILLYKVAMTNEGTTVVAIQSNSDIREIGAVWFDRVVRTFETVEKATAYLRSGGA
jgi:hypothetical protein